MNKYYFLWAFGKDRTGFVADVTKALFRAKANIEDSSMMRLGSEFGMFLIFSSSRALPKFKTRSSLQIGIKPISKKLATFKPVKKAPLLLTLHGADRPGLVYHVTQMLSRHRFNITDLSTHRVGQRKKAGFILMIEGELLKGGSPKKLKTAVARLAKTLRTKMTIHPVSYQLI